MKDSFVMQLVREPIREGALLDLLFTEKDWWKIWRSGAVLGRVLAER